MNKYEKMLEDLKKKDDVEPIYKESKIGESTLAVKKSKVKYSELYNDVENPIVIDSIDKEAQLVFGWASVTVNTDGSIPHDWDEDIMATRVLEKAAYNYVLNYRVSGKDHVKGEISGHLVESMMFTEEKYKAMDIPVGKEGLWVGFYIPDKEDFEKVKKGDFGMFSIEGYSKQIKL